MGLQHRILNNNSPFESEIFEVAKGERSEMLDKGPSVILASGGMMNGGASLEYFKALAEDPKNTMIFVGYNSASSLGRRIQNGLERDSAAGRGRKAGADQDQHAGKDGGGLLGPQRQEAADETSSRT